MSLRRLPLLSLLSPHRLFLKERIREWFLGFSWLHKSLLCHRWNKKGWHDCTSLVARILGHIIWLGEIGRGTLFGAWRRWWYLLARRPVHLLTFQVGFWATWYDSWNRSSSIYWHLKVPASHLSLSLTRCTHLIYVDVEWVWDSRWRSEHMLASKIGVYLHVVTLAFRCFCGGHDRLAKLALSARLLIQWVPFTRCAILALFDQRVDF